MNVIKSTNGKYYDADRNVVYDNNEIIHFHSSDDSLKNKIDVIAGALGLNKHENTLLYAYYKHVIESGNPIVKVADLIKKCTDIANFHIICYRRAFNSIHQKLIFEYIDNNFAYAKISDNYDILNIKDDESLIDNIMTNTINKSSRKDKKIEFPNAIIIEFGN